MDHHQRQQQQQQQPQQQQQQQQHGHPSAAARSISPEPEPFLSGTAGGSSSSRVGTCSSSQYPPVTTTFRSQRITSPLAGAGFGFGPAAGSPPMLLQHDRSMDQKLPASVVGSAQWQDKSNSNATTATTTTTTATDKKNKKEAIGTIPMLPRHHILERTAVRIPETHGRTMDAVLERVLEYLRLRSISYHSQADSGCLECEAMGEDGMVGFVIQLWRDFDSFAAVKMIILEAQRREGCSIAMNTIRRGLVHHVKGDEQSQQQPARLHHHHHQQQQQLHSSATQQQHQGPASLLGRRRRSHCQANDSNDDDHAMSGQQETFDSDTHDQHKRPRSLSPRTARAHCQDALAISLQLLYDVTRHDQNLLGLQSLIFMTDPRVVEPLDVLLVSRALVLGEGPCGPALQASLTALLRRLHPGGRGGSGSLERNSNKDSMLYHLTLQVLANALGGVEGSAISLSCSLWQIVMECLLHSLEDANLHPHEAALSAKCIRRLLPATRRAVVAAASQQQQQQLLQEGFLGASANMIHVHATAKRALLYGQSHHKSLEQEAGRLLGSFPTAA